MKKLMIILLIASLPASSQYLSETLKLDCSVTYEKLPRHKNNIVKEMYIKSNTSGYVEVRKSNPNFNPHTVAKLDVNGANVYWIFVDVGCEVDDDKISCKTNDRYNAKMILNRNTGSIDFSSKSYGKGNTSIEEKVTGVCRKATKKF